MARPPEPARPSGPGLRKARESSRWLASWSISSPCGACPDEIPIGHASTRIRACQRGFGGQSGLAPSSPRLVRFARFMPCNSLSARAEGGSKPTMSSHEIREARMFLDQLMGVFANAVAIDLGTANTLVYLRGKGIVLNEPSVVAVDRTTGKVIAVGKEAKSMLGRTPDEIVAVRPLKDGVIADFEKTEDLLREFIQKALRRRTWVRPRIIICVPSGITEVEKRAVQDSAQHAGAREVLLVPEPIAAAIGVGLPVGKPSGNMIIDIGGGTTEIAVMALNSIVNQQSIRVGGDEMDEAIVQYVKKAYNLLIGEQTAEAIKIKIGSAFRLEQEEEMEIKGRDLVAGIPKTMKISSVEVREALSEPLQQIVDALMQSLEKTPPELASDIVDRGIVMTGGRCPLRGRSRRLGRRGCGGVLGEPEAQEAPRPGSDRGGCNPLRAPRKRALEASLGPFAGESFRPHGGACDVAEPGSARRKLHDRRRLQGRDPPERGRDHPRRPRRPHRARRAARGEGPHAPSSRLRGRRARGAIPCRRRAAMGVRREPCLEPPVRFLAGGRQTRRLGVHVGPRRHLSGGRARGNRPPGGDRRKRADEGRSGEARRELPQSRGGARLLAGGRGARPADAAPGIHGAR